VLRVAVYDVLQTRSLFTSAFETQNRSG